MEIGAKRIEHLDVNWSDRLSKEMHFAHLPAKRVAALSSILSTLSVIGHPHRDRRLVKGNLAIPGVFSW